MKLPVRKRLFWRIYFTLLASLAVLTLLGGVVAWTFDDADDGGRSAWAGRVMQAILPPADAPAEEQAAALLRLGAAAGVDIALYGTNGARLASHGAALPALQRDPEARRGPPWRRVWLADLPDGRHVAVRLPRNDGPAWWKPLQWLALVALVVGLLAHPIVWLLVRRLERLRRGVEAFGAGALSARVPVEGRDEVADLAQSFNAAAERLERLVAAHKTLLANASHELRSPLARLRMALEMMAERPDGPYRAEAVASIAEIDALVEEILLASRLEAVDRLDQYEKVDLLALAAEEGARVGASVDGAAAEVQGDPRLLRRLIRNLLENAVRHAAPPVEVEVAQQAGGVRLSVLDRGAGVPAAEAARLFQPFYRPAGAAETGRGWGLGLALVRQIAERHGGRVSIAPREGGGSAFVVDLPA